MARLLSALFYPLLIPTYAMVLVFLSTYLSMTAGQARWAISLVTLAITAGVPLIGIYLMFRVGLVRNPLLHDRRDRLFPYVLTSVCYMGEAIYLWRLHAPQWLVIFMIAGGVVLITGAIINLRWKISGHSMGMGALTAMVAYLAHEGLLLDAPLAWLAGILLLSGAVMSSRLALDRHTLGQVLTGYVFAVVVMLGAVTIFD